MTIQLIAVLLVLILLCLSVYIYNTLVKYRNLMKEAWSGTDVYLKKRYDLIPNLIETVKGYAKHEAALMESITQQRVSAMQSGDSAAQITAEKGLTRDLQQLMVLAENYPDLKANTNFLQLQLQLQTIESEIEMSRRYYNGTVRQNNIYIQSVPGNIFAAIFKFPKGNFFEVQNPQERENTTVSF